MLFNHNAIDIPHIARKEKLSEESEENISASFWFLFIIYFKQNTLQMTNPIPKL